MPDYKEMYLTMVKASEGAINALIEAQRRCEELYLSALEPKIMAFTPDSPKNDKKDG